MFAAQLFRVMHTEPGDVLPCTGGRKTEHQRQQHLNISMNSDLHTMHAWTQLPGAIATLEAVIRADHSLNRLEIAFQRAGTAIEFMVVASSSSHPAMLPACISLAATVQKMLHSFTHAFDAGSARNVRAEQRHQWERADNKGVRPSADSIGTIQTLINQLLDAITALDKSNKLYSSGSPGLTNYKDCSAVPVTGGRNSKSDHRPGTIERLTSEVTSMAAEGTQVNEQGRVMYPFASQRAIHVYQVQTILVGILVPLCHMRIMAAEADPVPWLTPVVRSLGVLKSRLSVVGTTLLAERVFSSGARELLVHTCMERFGMACFSGRLNPGCCHLGCESMGGCSESSLRTWLCSGCRMARYCSRVCQKEAWEEGHKTVCGNYRGLHGALV